MYINTNDTSTPTHNQISGPITQAHARQLNNQVSSFLASYSSYLDNGNVYYVLLLRNNGAPGKLLESTFICIKPQVHIMSEPATIVILVQRPFSANGAATPYFWPIGSCIMLSTIWTHPRVGVCPSFPEVVLPHL
jgi:hypothetical protein